MQWQSVLYFLLWAGVFAVMMRFGCGAHVMGHRHRHTDSASGRTNGSNERTVWTAPERDIDPVCGKTVPTAAAKSVVYGGRAFYFCSQACREKFEAAPATYAESVHTNGISQEHHHGAHC